MAAREQLILEFNKARMVHGRGMSVRVPMMDRLRASRRTPEAVVKVVSYGRGSKGVGKSMAYISRDGELALETEEGELVRDLSEQKELVKDWSIDFDDRANSRDAAHIVFSMPPGGNPEALRKAVRKVIRTQFAGHQAVFVLHQEKKHPHAHAIIKMRGRELGKKLELRKADLYELRQAFAQASREQGVELNATSRAVRGVGQKGMERELYQMRERGVEPEVKKLAQASFRDDLREDRVKDKSWERILRLHNGNEREAYLLEAEKFERTVKNKKVHNPKSYLEAARDLRKFCDNFPAALTERQQYLQNAGIRMTTELPRRERDQGMER